jgi:hypothetical protein
MCHSEREEEAKVNNIEQEDNTMQEALYNKQTISIYTVHSSSPEDA